MIARCVAFCVIFTLSGVLRAQPAESVEQLFENHIRPVLAGTCFSCHGDPNAKLAGGLRVDSREALLAGGDSGPAIELDKIEQSLLLKAIERSEGVSPMPPNQDRALRADQVAAFKKWIAAGAPWPKQTAKFESPQHWAFQPLRDSDGAFDIDHWIRVRQTAAKVEMAPPADKRTLLRRATFDLTGLPPTHEQAGEFLMDESPQAFAHLIDRLLASPAYGERWGRHWLDVVRYADTAGETADYPVPNAWRYRNYVIDAFHRDKPYDQFLREQIAGDILAEQETSPQRYAEQVTATGYLAISRRFGFDSENYHHLTIQDTIDTLGQSILGLSLGCARCHDHKFDPISMQDYYALYGIFDSSRYAFPGSEQKQKVRSMMPTLPARQALASWRKFDERIADIRLKLERNGQAATPAVLRMLNDMDGDFELQAPAAGGSNGVLVPPWLAEGPVAVSNAAQSPFRNIYGPGKSGIRIEASSDSEMAYCVKQAIYPQRTADRDPRLLVNLDFRCSGGLESSTGTHQVWLGGYPNSPALTLDISHNLLRWSKTGIRDKQTNSCALEAGKWTNVQVVIDTVSRKCSLRVGEPGNEQHFEDVPLQHHWNGAIDLLMLRSGPEVSSGARPAIELDNVAVMDAHLTKNEPTRGPSPNDQMNQDVKSISNQLNELVGTDSDFELQTIDSPPSAPWNPGPNSVVKIMSRAQSPDGSLFAMGRLGVHMPNRAPYDGFGCVLPTAWKADAQDKLYASFDFRAAESGAGGEGSWRFYVGHGPGNSAAVELFMNAQQFFVRSGEERSAVGMLETGQWYQVELELRLKERKFIGQVKPLEGDAQAFVCEGSFPQSWDGTIDYTFIDSYGHIGGVRPALDVDNYIVGPPRAGFPRQSGSAEAAQSVVTADPEKPATVRRLREQLSALKESLRIDSEWLERELASGPFEMAYAVAEGTPHDVAVQLRGEPSQPGEVVPRGFIKVLGGKSLPADAPGSGRKQLAEWLTRDVAHLTARVMVNRLWQFHFGRGLVTTPNDFGVRGVTPTHPQLLDQLAAEFIASGWSIKHMHRRIMLSQVYQQSSIWPGSQSASLLSRDLYVGFERRRLSAEEIRDSILSVTGLLDKTAGTSHPFSAPTNWGYTQHSPFTAVYDHDKRSVYLMTQRLKRHPFLALFDGADPNASTAVRLGTTVPTQALYFMNDPFVHRASLAWAERLTQAPEAERFHLAYEVAFQREPTAAEKAEAIQFIADYRQAMAQNQISDTPAGQLPWAAWLRTLIGSNEFLHID